MHESIVTKNTQVIYAWRFYDDVHNCLSLVLYFQKSH